MALGGVTGKGFLPGQCGNPGGRPKGLARLIREATNDGEKLTDYFLKVFEGETFEYTVYDKNGDTRRIKHVPTLKERNEAGMWLADRGWGKPSSLLDDNGEEENKVFVEFMDKSTEELEAEIERLRQQIKNELREQMVQELQAKPRG